MRIGIIQFPGSNCERETMLAVKRAGMEPVEFLWNEAREKLQTMSGYVIVGGFSYEDRSRAGIIAALDPVMQEIAVQSEQGKPVLGICNGAQILVETGLVPGLENNKTAMVLTENKRVANGKILGTGYYNAWVNMRLTDQYQRNAFTRHLTSKHILHVPVAHGEGRFVMTDMLLSEIEHQGLNVFQYCDAEGNIIDSFPINPNGSLRNIAAISNKAGNVMAMMPHPERTLNGDPLFHSMRDYIAEVQIKTEKTEKTIPLYYYPRKSTIPVYQKPAAHHECIVELMITDNQALTVQNTLQQLGIPVTVKRQMHWEIQCDNPAIIQQVKQSGVIYNERKESEISSAQLKSSSSALFLVRPREDVLGQQKLQTLQDHFSITGVNAIQHGVLWQFTCKNANISDFIDNILHTNIISNPYAHDCYRYQ
jgi:phosphoribosylformylglycinamidine synthase